MIEKLIIRFTYQFKNELVAAYNQPRNREFTRLHRGKHSYVDADKKYSDPRTDKSVKEKLKEKNICYKIDVSNEIVLKQNQIKQVNYAPNSRKRRW